VVQGGVVVVEDKNMMECLLEKEIAHYGSDLFCKTCGMNIELKNKFINKGNKKIIYCCERCAK
jgi:hypothetical protein